MSETEVVANIEVVDNNINAKAIATTVVEGKEVKQNTKVIQAKVDSFTVTGNENSGLKIEDNGILVHSVLVIGVVSSGTYEEKSYKFNCFSKYIR